MIFFQKYDLLIKKTTKITIYCDFCCCKQVITASLQTSFSEQDKVRENIRKAKESYKSLKPNQNPIKTQSKQLFGILSWNYGIRTAAGDGTVSMHTDGLYAGDGPRVRVEACRWRDFGNCRICKKTCKKSGMSVGGYRVNFVVRKSGGIRLMLSARTVRRTETITTNQFNHFL